MASPWMSQKQLKKARYGRNGQFAQPRLAGLQRTRQNYSDCWLDPPLTFVIRPRLEKNEDEQDKRYRSARGPEPVRASLGE